MKKFLTTREYEGREAGNKMEKTQTTDKQRIGSKDGERDRLRE